MPLVAKGSRPPKFLSHLPYDHERGYVVPWFVHWQNGVPEFRVIVEEKRGMAWDLGLCWVCGKELPVLSPRPMRCRQTFVIGPMCSVNRVSSEPGSHPDCAAYAVQACPFLTKPHMVRRDNDLPEGSHESDGIMILRNPGVICLWESESASISVIPGDGGWLIDIGEPLIPPSWYYEGRFATRAEVDESVRTGLPALQAEATAAGPRHVAVLECMLAEAKKHFPRD
jgi:hypothetical protein